MIGNLNEHEAAPRDDLKASGDNYSPTEQEEKDIKLVEKLFDKAKKERSKHDSRWNDFYNMFRGRQWKENRPTFRHSEVINLIFREIQSAVPIMLDTRPKFDYMPQEPSDIEFAEIVNQVCQSDWERNNWLAQLTEAVFDGHIMGTGVVELDFDQKLEDGLGSIYLESEDPFYIFPDPAARDVNLKSRFFIEAEPMCLEEIKRSWPNGKYVKKDVADFKKQEYYDKDKIRLKSPNTDLAIADGLQGYDTNTEAEALVITAWIDGSFEIDEESIEEPSSDGTLTTKYVQKMRYPKGRKIVIASKVVLESGENPNDDRKFPFARYQNYVNQRQFWGISDIEQLESPQRVFNKLVSFALDVLTLMGNPIWLVGTSSGVDPENLFNQPGLIVEADNIDQVRRQEGVQLQPYVLQLIDRLKLWFDDISGDDEVSRGVRPEGITAASAISNLQEASKTRIRQKSRNLDSMLQNLGQMYFSRVMQYYTAPRIFRLTNAEGSMQFFKFHVEQLPDDEGYLARYRSYHQGEDGQIFEGEEKQIKTKGQLDVRVTTGSSLPFLKVDREQKAFQLFDRQIIDDEEVLKSLDYPNWERVLQRVNEKKAQAAEAQMQAQASAGAAPQ